MNAPPDFVYVIAMDAGHHKIGISGRPEARLAQLQTSHPRPLQLLFMLKTNRAQKVERAAHNILYRQRLAGEWFAVAGEVAINAVLKADSRYPPRPESCDLGDREEAAVEPRPIAPPTPRVRNEVMARVCASLPLGPVPRKPGSMLKKR